MTVSLTGMIFLLIHKYMEVNKGTKTAMQNVRQKTDPVLRDIHQTTTEILSNITPHNIILLANHVFVSIVRFFMYISHRVHTISSSIVEKASKKKEDLSRGGAASFYLKQIKQSKENGENTNKSTKETGGEQGKI